MYDHYQCEIQTTWKTAKPIVNRLPFSVSSFLKYMSKDGIFVKLIILLGGHGGSEGKLEMIHLDCNGFGSFI